jgi:hypothetical protein
MLKSAQAQSQHMPTNAEAYLELAAQARKMVAPYNSRAEWFAKTGQEQIAAEYRKLSREAVERAERYEALARRAKMSC